MSQTILYFVRNEAKSSEVINENNAADHANTPLQPSPPTPTPPAWPAGAEAACGADLADAMPTSLGRGGSEGCAATRQRASGMRDLRVLQAGARRGSQGWGR